MSELVGYQLDPGPRRALRDRYWDTPDGRLGDRRLGLRLREQDGELRFTIKGPATVKDGLFSREELELAASSDGWRAMRARLVEQGIDLPERSSDAADPAAWLVASGLRITQDRSTDRRVLVARHGQQPMVEIALDTTTYRIDVYEIGFREIEVEALTDEVEHVEALGAGILARFGDRVAPSKQGKYGRGLELQARLS